MQAVWLSLLKPITSTNRFGKSFSRPGADARIERCSSSVAALSMCSAYAEQGKTVLAVMKSNCLTSIPLSPV